MICLVCKKQIPDDSKACPHCGYTIDHQKQIVQEIKQRRYQRWIFYFLISFVFLAMVAVIVKIYRDNTKLLEDTTKKQSELEEAIKNLNAREKELAAAQDSLKTASGELTQTEQELAKKTEDFKQVLDEKGAAEEKYQTCQLDLNSADANVYSLIIKLGKGISNKDLSKIPLADANLGGDDSDQDGLSNLAEESLGTNKDKKDTDGDGFNDKEEIAGGYNPAGAGKLAIDKSFSEKNKGLIFLQVESRGQAWYVGGDGKRYFLGQPADAFA